MSAAGVLPDAKAVPLDQLSASERSASWRTRFLLREWVAGSLFVIPTLYMAAALARATGGPAPVITGQWRGGDVRHVFASAERARSELGFAAAEDFEAGMREFAAAKLRA